MTVTAINKKNKKQEPVDEPVKAVAPMEITEENAQADAYRRIVAATQEVDAAREKMVLAGKAAAAAKQVYQKAIETQMNLVRNSTQKLPLIDMMEKQVLIDKLLALPRYTAQWVVNLLIDGIDVPGVAAGDDGTKANLCEHWQVLAGHFGLPTAEPGPTVRYHDSRYWQEANVAPESVINGRHWGLPAYLGYTVAGEIFTETAGIYGDDLRVGDIVVTAERCCWPEVGDISLDDYAAGCATGPIAKIELEKKYKGLGDFVLVRWNYELGRVETLAGLPVVKIEDPDEEEPEDDDQDMLEDDLDSDADDNDSEEEVDE